MQATSVGGRYGVLLATLLLVAWSAVAPEDILNSEVSFPKDIPGSALGVSMITSGTKVLSGVKGHVEDPFAQLAEDSDESLLSVDGDQDSPTTAAGPRQAEAAPTEFIAPTEAKAPRVIQLVQRFIPFGLVFLFTAAIGIALPRLVDYAACKEHKLIKLGATPQGTFPLAAASSPTDASTDGGSDAAERPYEEAEANVAKDPEEEDEYGCTALHCAANSGAADEVQELLRLGASVNRQEAWGETPLHFAARSGSVEVCKLLLAHNAELNPVNESECTPLLLAAEAGKEAVCKLLLERGAHAGGKPDNELPPLLSALLVERIFAEVNAAASAVTEDSE